MGRCRSLGRWGSLDWWWALGCGACAGGRFKRQVPSIKLQTNFKVQISNLKRSDFGAHGALRERGVMNHALRRRASSGTIAVAINPRVAGSGTVPLTATMA